MDQMPKISDTDIFYHEVCLYLSSLKLVYGGQGLKVFFFKHPDIYRWLKAKLRDCTIDIENQFATLNIE